MDRRDVNRMQTRGVQKTSGQEKDEVRVKLENPRPVTQLMAAPRPHSGVWGLLGAVQSQQMCETDPEPCAGLHRWEGCVYLPAIRR